MDWSDGALPMGMLFFATTILSFFRKKAGNMLAAQQYPKLAAQRGWEYLPSRYKAGVGTLKGELKGQRFIVDPDDRRGVFMPFSEELELELLSYREEKRGPVGTSTFRFEDAHLRSIFPTARASDLLADRLEKLSEPSSQLMRLKKMRELKVLAVRPSGLEAVFDFGNPPFIPVDVVEIALEAFVELKEQLTDE